MIGRWSPNPQPQAEEPQGYDAFEVRLGDLMRGERATLGKSLIDVQRELKIKASYIAAIENADVAAFDTPGFIAGYVRSYARYLGLDPEWAWTRFCEEAGFEVPHGLSSAASALKPARKTGLDALGDPNASFAPRPESLLEKIEWRAMGSFAILLVLIGGIGYGAWSVLQEIQRVDVAPAGSAPGAVVDLAPVSASGEEASAAPPSGDALDRLYRPAALDTPVLVARDGPIAAVEPGSVGALAENRARPPAAEGAIAPETLAAAEPDAPQVTVEEAALVVLAVRPSWVQVTASDGSVLYEKIMEPGESWTVPAMDEAPRLRTGNSGAIYFSLGTATYGPVAPGAQVVRDVPLTAEAVVDTFAPGDSHADPDLAVAVALAQTLAPAPEDAAGE